MTILRTPKSRFEDLPGYPFKTNYTEVGNGLQLHYVDEGDKTAPVVLLLHGEPSWSYLYRKMIPIITQAGYRAIAPDLIGFGKSDKPADKEAYSYANHIDWLYQLLQKLELNDMTLFCQDWGGLIGLRILADHPHLFKSAVAANTFLPTGEYPMPDAFMKWRQFSQISPDFPISGVIKMATVHDIPEAVLAAYDAPFPDESYKAGARQFPVLVPIDADDPEAVANRVAWKVLSQWDKPFLTLFSDSDPIMAGAEKVFKKFIPGTANMPHHIIEKAGHFLQEDQGEDIAQRLVSFMQQYT